MDNSKTLTRSIVVALKSPKSWGATNQFGRKEALKILNKIVHQAFKLFYFNYVYVLPVKLNRHDVVVRA